MKKTPKELYNKAFKLKKRLTPEEEQIISTSPAYSYWYARDIIQGRWPEAEEAMKTYDHDHDNFWGIYKEHFKQEFEIEEILNS